MVDSRPIRRSMTVDEYRALEERSSVRHEYIDGLIYAMTGATRRHNRIVGNIFRRLADAADDGPCRIYIEAVRVRVSERVFYYPDVAVACGEPGDAREENSPCVIVEVTSPSTRRTDRREKVFFYRQNPTLRAYVIVHQDQRRVDCHFRDGNEAWSSASYFDDDSVPIPCPAIQLALMDIYAGIEREGGGPLPTRPPLRVRERVPRGDR